MIVNFNPNVDWTSYAMSDGSVETNFQAAVQGGLEKVNTSNMLFVTRCRLGVKEGDLESLVIVYKGVEYPVTNEGFIEDWGEMMEADVYFDLLMRLTD